MRNNVCARKVKSQKQNIMKQFDLDEYLANPSRKVITRRGLNARIICTDRKDLIYPIVALIETKSGGEYLLYFTKDGKYYVDDLYEDDLFFAPEKHEGWVNIYKAGVHKETLVCMVNRFVGSSIWPNEVAAKEAADPDPIATIKIEWEE